MARYKVTAIEPVTLAGPEQLTSCQLMSPYVWQPTGERGLAMLVRAVSQGHAKHGGGVSGTIWLAMADDAGGLTFTAQAAPLIEPGPGQIDLLGCEDPTVVPTDEECIVYYTGLDRQGDAQLLYASGPDVRSLRKQGIAYASSQTERNTKEATIDRTDTGEWRLMFEYSRDNRSRIGVADGTGPAGYWIEHDDPIEAREGMWDGWHLSTGPLLMDEPDGPLMFYNGSDARPYWGIGWAIMAPDCLSVRERCDGPLIAPPTELSKQVEICFAASALRNGSEIWLYFTRDDLQLFRATVVRSED